MTTTTTGYDRVGNLVSLTDASGNETTFDYDGLDRLVTETDAFDNPILREYDDAGRLTREYSRFLKASTGNRAFQNFTYDDLDRVTREDWHSHSASQAKFHSVRYTYNDAGLLARTEELRGDQSGPPRQEYDFTYDDLSRLTSVVDTANTAADAVVPTPLEIVQVQLDYSYDAQGDLISTTSSIQPVGSGGGCRAILSTFTSTMLWGG